MRAEARFSISIDARALSAPGIGRYLREVLRAIAREPRFGRINLLGDREKLAAFAASLDDPQRVNAIPLAGGFYSLRAQAGWLALRGRAAGRADVTFFPHYDAPYFALPARSVVTIQDLTHFKVPEHFPWWKRAAAGRVFDRAASGAARLLVTSQSTRADLVERLPAVAEKVETIPLGVSPAFAPLDDPVAEAEPPFLLCVGNRPHKNVRAAVEALGLLRRRWPELRLVVVGSEAAGRAETLARGDALGLRGAIVEHPVVNEAGLRHLYSTCRAFLFPSLYEGFGLPVLEAMACGAPVIGSDRASVPEVVGDAGLLVDPLDPDALAGAVARVLSEPGLREDMRQRGLRRAALFPWALTGERTVRVLLATAAAAATCAEADPHPEVSATAG
jgi:glycosyltransferase involved in cell wall biosynthesis